MRDWCGPIAIAAPCSTKCSHSSASPPSNNRFYFVADAYYAAHKIVAGLLKQNNHLLTRMKSNAVAYTAYQQRGPRKRRPPPGLWQQDFKLGFSLPVASLQRLPTSPKPRLRREHR